MPDELSPEEIDQLLQNLPVEDAQRKEHRLFWKIYDFRRPDLFTKSVIQRLAQTFDSLCSKLTQELNNSLQKSTTAKLETVDMMCFEEFIGGLSEDCDLVMMRMPPLDSHAFMAIPDILKKDLYTPEPFLFETLFKKALAEHWRPFQHISPRTVNRTTEPHAIEEVPPLETILLFSIYINIEDTKDFIEVCFPYQLLKPIVKILTPQPEPLSPEESVELELTMALHDSLTVAQLTALEKGKSLPLKSPPTLTINKLLSLEVALPEPGSPLWRVKEPLPKRALYSQPETQRAVKIYNSDAPKSTNSLESLPFKTDVVLWKGTSTVEELKQLVSDGLLLDRSKTNFGLLQAGGRVFAQGEIYREEDNLCFRITRLINSQDYSS